MWFGLASVFYDFRTKVLVLYVGRITFGQYATFYLLAAEYLNAVLVLVKTSLSHRRIDIANYYLDRNT